MTFPELIRSQEDLLRRLLAASQQQVEVVERGDATFLDQFLRQSSRLWVEFELLDQQLAPHKGLPPEQRVWKNSEERRQTELTVKRCEELFQEIIANVQISLTKGEELNEKVKKDLRRVQQAKSAAPAYAKQSQMQR